MLARIQHHPSRNRLLPALVESLSPLRVEISTHTSEPPNPWLGYKQALSAPDIGESHVVVLQDDVLVCENFAPAVERIAERWPDHPVVLFLAKLPPHIARLSVKASKRKETYVRTLLRVNDFMPVVGVLWPCHKAAEFLAWAEEAKLPGYPRITRSDDAVAGRWAASTRQEIIFTVPSLVQHPDTEPSLIGRKRAWGKDGGRVALMFCEGDPLRYEW